ncbi:MAG: response regulator [Leptospiraceae bacterium]|nr:response regulator [Leptospiraceae bacterium]
MNRIIITDDSISARLTIQKYMEDYFQKSSRTGMEFRLAESGEALLALLNESSELALITLDVNMPGKDGLTLATEIRQRSETAPILMISANVQQAVQDRARELGLSFLEKPIDSERLSAKLKELGL